MIPLPKRNSDGSYTGIPTGMQIDGDGANGQSSAPVYGPVGYKPEPLDHLANAGGPGNWYGVVTDTGASNGKPFVQRNTDPAPGAYVSATSYKHANRDRTDPLAYVDANAIVYIVLPAHWRKEAVGVVLGCRAEIHDTKTGKTIAGAVIDFGPRSHWGEASIACAREFGIPHSPKHGGTDERRFVYTFWPGQAASGFELQPMG